MFIGTNFIEFDNLIYFLKVYQPLSMSYPYYPYAGLSSPYLSSGSYVGGGYRYGAYLGASAAYPLASASASASYVPSYSYSKYANWAPVSSYGKYYNYGVSYGAPVNRWS